MNSKLVYQNIHRVIICNIVYYTECVFVNVASDVLNDDFSTTYRVIIKTFFKTYFMSIEKYNRFHYQKFGI